MNFPGTVVLETERLVIRPFCEADAHDMFYNWANSSHVTRYLTWPVYKSVADAEETLNAWVKDYENPKNFNWCIEWKENHQAIGSIGVVHMNEEIKEAEIGYCIGEAHWKKGIMTEALKAVMEFLFVEAGFNRVCARHDTNNPNSGRVMKAAGMLYEGTMRQAGKNNMGICDLTLYAITKDLYFKHSS